MPEDAGTGAEIVYFSTKQAEEVGFDKFARRQAQLQGIHVLVLDHMQIRANQSRDEDETIAHFCANVTDLDLSSNLFESLQDIVELASLLPKLLHLNLSGNRFEIGDNVPMLDTIRTLDLSDTWLAWNGVLLATKSFPSLRKLTVARNGLTSLSSGLLPSHVQDLDLSDNAFKTLSGLSHLNSCSELRTLTLKRNQVETVSDHFPSSIGDVLSGTIETLDLAQNAISLWSFFDSLTNPYPALRHLITTGIPLYESLHSAEGKPLSKQDGYMLTIARLPQLDMLNYSKVTEKERLNSETYYLGQIAAELGNKSAETEREVLRRHPRWEALCEEYGEPSSRREPKAEKVDSRSLAARLLKVSFVLSPDQFPDHPSRHWEREIPKTLNIYSLIGLVGKRLNIMPLKLRLVWETGEQDPMSQGDGYTGPEWWDSSDESDNDPVKDEGSVLREVELVPGTRALGTYIEDSEARIRVEMRNK